MLISVRIVSIRYYCYLSVWVECTWTLSAREFVLSHLYNLISPCCDAGVRTSLYQYFPHELLVANHLLLLYGWWLKHPPLCLFFYVHKSVWNALNGCNLQENVKHLPQLISTGIPNNNKLFYKSFGVHIQNVSERSVASAAVLAGAIKVTTLFKNRRYW